MVDSRLSVMMRVLVSIVQCMPVCGCGAIVSHIDHTVDEVEKVLDIVINMLIHTIHTTTTTTHMSFTSRHEYTVDTIVVECGVDASELSAVGCGVQVRLRADHEHGQRAQ